MSAKTRTVDATNAFGPTQPTDRVKLALVMPATLYDKFAEQGVAANRTPEQEIAERLKSCQDHRAGRGLYFNDEQRARLERITGHLIQSPDQVLTQMEHIVSLEVNDIVVNLDAKLQQRLRSRVFRGETYEGVVKREVVLALERFCGLKPY